MPFGKDLAPGMLHVHGAHAEAVARIQWCICEQLDLAAGERGVDLVLVAVQRHRRGLGHRSLLRPQAVTGSGLYDG